MLVHIVMVATWKFGFIPHVYRINFNYKCKDVLCTPKNDVTYDTVNVLQKLDLFHYRKYFKEL